MTNGILLNGSADIDFMIHGVFPYQFFGQTVWITTTHICLLIVLLLILAFAIAANRAMKHASEVPGFFQNIVELVVEKLDGMVKMVMGKNAAKFANYIGTIFIFILISNFSGLLGLRPPTADYGVTLPLGLATFTLIHYRERWQSCAIRGQSGRRSILSVILQFRFRCLCVCLPMCFPALL